jgi:ribonuclease HI
LPRYGGKFREKTKKYGRGSMSAKKRVVLYTDGACSGNPGLGGYGGILMYKDVRREFSGAEENTTNNRMEVLAVIEGLKRLKYPCEVDVYSDSAYTVNAFNEGWIYAWQNKGWKKADGKAVQNVDLWEELLALLKVHKVVFHKVAGHADNEDNNRCDELARTAIVELRKTLPVLPDDTGEKE